MWTEFISELTDDPTFSDPATAARIAAAEANLGSRLPGELRELLLETNGVEAEYVSLVWDIESIAAHNHQFRTNAEYPELYMPFDALLFSATRATATSLPSRSSPGSRRATTCSCGTTRTTAAIGSRRRCAHSSSGC